MKYDVCVFGGCALDQTFFQKIDGSFQDVPDVIAPGGKGANQAIAAAKAGAKTAMISRIGKDEIGNKILNNLMFYGIDTSCVEVEKGLNNDYGNIYINVKDKDNTIERFTGAINSFTPDMVHKYEDVILKSKIIMCQLKVPKEVAEELIHFCYQNKKTLILTPCRPEKLSIDDPHNLELIDQIRIITCNRKECETIFHTSNIEECVKKYPNKLIVTLGEDGLIYSDGNRVIQMPSIDVDIVDTTGAGDTLSGNLGAFLAQGIDLAHALRKAMYASAMKLTQKTAQAGMPYLDELEAFIRNKRNKNFEYGEELNYIFDEIKYAYDRVKYSSFEIRSKADSTLVTDTDLAIEEYLLNKIKEKYPNDHFVTEENYPTNQLSNRTWIIDPIDGTAHFIKKDGMWGIQLAFYDKGETRFSIIYLPEKNEYYYAAQNQGVYVNNEKILSLEQVPLSHSVVEFGGSVYKSLDVKRMCLNKLMIKDKLIVSNILQINASCISYTNLIMGRTDALILATKNPWDIMPGELMCKELGIKMYYLDSEQKVRLLTLNDEIKNLILDN